MFCGAFFLYCAGFRYANVKSSDEKYKDDENGYKRTQAPGEYQWFLYRIYNLTYTFIFSVYIYSFSI